MEPLEQLGAQTTGAVSGDAGVPALLERRALAAAVDAALVSLCGLGLFVSFSPLSSARHLWVWAPSAAVLAGIVALEWFTAATLGKRLAGLALRRPDGGHPPVWALILRGCVRLLPVAIFLLGLAMNDELVSGIACIVAAIMSLCYIVVAYLLLMRTGRTPFDAVAGTVVARSRRRLVTPARPE